MARIANLGSGNPEMNRDVIWRLWPDAEIVNIDGDPTTGAEVNCDLRQLTLDDGSFDGAFLSHVLEHFCEADGLKVLGEIWRILKVDGKAVVRVPDLRQACFSISIGKGLAVAYSSLAGPIRAMDVLFGLQQSVGEHPLMTHRWGFDQDSLQQVLTTVGFKTRVSVGRMEIIGEGFKNAGSSNQISSFNGASDRGLHRIVLPRHLD